MTCTVTAFYKFVRIDDCETLRQHVAAATASGDIKGTVLIAREGINATVAGADPAIAQFLATLRADPRFADLEDKKSYCAEQPFGKMKVKVKREIVTFGLPNADPTIAVGTYVEPRDWNALIVDPEVVVVDTRNDYEYAIGTFAGAENPNTRSFSELPRFVAETLAADKSRKVAMFCTGGIRCEKATAYLLSEGFTNVYHLKGGILKYLEEVPATDSLWHGECFVFDGRVALRHGVVEGSHARCARCGNPVPAIDDLLVSPVCTRCRDADTANPT